MLTGYIATVHMLLKNLFLNVQDGDHTQTLLLLPEIELLAVSVHVCAGEETQQEWLVAYEGVADSRTEVYLYMYDNQAPDEVEKIPLKHSITQLCVCS